MKYVTPMFIFSLVLLLYGALFLYLGRRSQEPANDFLNRRAATWNILKKWFLAFGFAYLALSHLSLLVAVGESIDPVATCEWVPQNATLSGNTTTYAFIDTCDGVATPGSVTALFTVYLWLLWINVFAIFLGSLLLVVGLLRRLL